MDSMTEPNTQIAMKKAAKDIGQEVVGELLGFVFLAVMAALLFWGIAPNSIRFPAFYSWKYSVPRSHVHVDNEPADCEWSYAPIGEKDCHYDKLVEPLRNARGWVTDVHVTWQKKVQVVSRFWKLSGEIGLCVTCFIIGWQTRGDYKKRLRRERDEDDDDTERVKKTGMTPQRLLFPWHGTVRRLELGKRWWHRLAGVAFVVMLGITLLVTWALMVDTDPTYYIASYWYVDGSGAKVDLPAPPPSGTTAVSLGTAGWDANGVPIPPPAAMFPVHVEVQMPDGKTKEFVGKSPEEVRAACNAELHELKVRQWLLSPVVAILVMLAMSYLLQSLYRVLLYVVYGSQKPVTV
jgi:hypothetical protein